MSNINFTSETIRLDSSNNSQNVHRNENDGGQSSDSQQLRANSLTTSSNQGIQKKKISSFQITSIRPTSRSSNDGADDSENDTEDTSDILDSSKPIIEGEKEELCFSEVESSPVISATSNSGLTALVQQTGSPGMMTARLPQGVTVNVTDGGLALASTDGQPDDLINWQKRFKIVKIDSTEPFKRGRWICLDFMDCPALSSSENKEVVPNLVVSNVVLSDGESSKFSEHNFVQIPLSLSSNPQTVPSQVPLIQNMPSSISTQGSSQYTSQPGHSSSVPPNSSQSAVPPSGQAPATIPVVSKQANASNVHSISTVQSNNESNSPSTTPINTASMHSVNAGHVHASTSANSEQQKNVAANPSSLNTGAISKQSLPSTVVITQASGSSSQQSTQHISQSVPSQMIQNVSSQSSGMQSNLLNAQPMAIGQKGPISHPAVYTSSGNVSQMSNAPINSLPSSIPSSSTVPSAMTAIPKAQTINQPDIYQTSIAGSQLVTTVSSQVNVALIDSAIKNSQIDAANVCTTASAPASVGSTEESERFVLNLMGSRDANSSKSASTASTVAIDNKIEQAMDLVKSHLMFAVREEVDVLKDRIVDLVDRVKHLECENSILRQYASPDVLQQIQSQMPPQIQQNPHHSSN